MTRPAEIMQFQAGADICRVPLGIGHVVGHSAALVGATICPPGRTSLAQTVFRLVNRDACPRSIFS